MKVSIVMPVYNATDALLARSLGSVFRQTENDWELVIIDDGSTNGCIERIPKKYRTDRRVRIVRQQNKGLDGALDTGINEVQGEYFYIIAQDDYMHLQTLEYCIKTLEREGADLCVFGGFRQLEPVVPEHVDLGDMAKIPCTVLSSRDMYDRPEEYVRILPHLNTDAWGHFVRTELVKKVHKLWPVYESSTRLHLMMRLARKWIASDAELYYYNASNPSSLSRKPITSRYVTRSAMDFLELCSIYQQEKSDKRASAVWNTVVKWFILRGTKILVNSFRRHNKKCDANLNRECLTTIAQMLKMLKSMGALPLRRINFRMYLIYRWIMLRYGSRVKPGSIVQMSKAAQFNDFLQNNNYVV